MTTKNGNKLQHHLTAVKEGKRCFENAFESIARMILESEIEKVVVNGRTTYDFTIFRTGKKHIISIYDEINSFVSYVKDAAEGGSSKEMAFVLVGEPGNGKTFFFEFLCSKYRSFLATEKNRKYTFRFTNMDRLGSYGKISTIESQTYEDPMILAMNLFEHLDDLGELDGFVEEIIRPHFQALLAILRIRKRRQHDKHRGRRDLFNRLKHLDAIAPISYRYVLSSYSYCKKMSPFFFLLRVFLLSVYDNNFDLNIPHPFAAWLLKSRFPLAWDIYPQREQIPRDIEVVAADLLPDNP